MPTYLTPGVYVEEVPSTSKPIEGVGTSIAAFVGLAPGGPVNTPMRISNWTQFAKIFGDPNEPDNGPFMEGAYLAHSVYGFFQNGGGLCWVVRVGAGNGAGSRPAAALPAAADKSIEAFHAEALEGRQRRRQGRAVGGAGRRRRGRRPDLQARRRRRHRRQGGVRRPDAQEGPPEPRDEGQRRLQVHQDHRDGRTARQPPRRPAPTRSRRPARRPRRSRRPTSRATSPGGRAWAASPRSTRSRWSACRTR